MRLNPRLSGISYLEAAIWAAIVCLVLFFIVSADRAVARRRGIEALSAATQFEKTTVAVSRGDPGLPSTGRLPEESFGTGEVARMVNEVINETGLPGLLPGSPLKNLLILAAVSSPVYDSGVNTNVQVVAALVRRLYSLDHGFSITVACAPEFWAAPGTPGAPDSLLADGFEIAGYRRMVEALGVEFPGIRLQLLELNGDSTKSYPAPGDASTFEVAAAVAEANYVILAAKLKTWELGLDCAIASLRLALPGRVNGWPRFAGLSPSRLDEMLVDLAGTVMVDYVLVDAINCRQGAGTPDEGVAVVNAVVGGEDILSVDAVCARLAGFDPLDMEYLEIAGDKKYGVVDPARIVVEGAEFPQDAVPLVRPRRAFDSPALSSPDYPYQGQGVRSLLFKFGAFSAADRDSLYLPWPGAAGWVESPRSPDEPLGPGEAGQPEAAAGIGLSYYWCPVPVEAELWAGSAGSLSVYLNGRLVLERRPLEGSPAERAFHIPNAVVPVSLPAGSGILEARVEFIPGADSTGQFSLALARAASEKKYAGSRVPELVYFLDPAGNQSLAGVVGIARPGQRVRGTDASGVVTEGVCGDRGGFILREVFPGDLRLAVFDSTGATFLADSTVYLEEWQTSLVDLRGLDLGTPALRGDYTNDGRLAVNDVIALLLGMRAGPSDPRYDFNGDGRNDIRDAIALLLAIRGS